MCREEIMNKRFTALMTTLILSVIFSISSSAYDVEVDGIYYNLISEGNVAEVTKGDNKYEGDIKIPSSINVNEAAYSVTSIKKYAFSNCSSLTSVTIPNSVTFIGDGAFYGCSGLTSVTIPNSVTFIGDGAFYGCYGLTSINVDSGNNNYSSLDGVLYNKLQNILIWYPAGKQGVFAIPNSVTSIGSYAFSGCTGLTSIIIPNSVTTIGDGAFQNCSSLTSITIPNSITSIGGYAFQGCTGLTSLIIPNSVTSIDDYAFGGCSSLTSINIPNSVASINISAFSGCSGLTSINVDSRNNNYSSLDGVLYNKLQNILICYPTGKRGVFAIPNSVTTIGDYAFNDCRSLTSITIGDSVTSIGSYAFQGCIGLTSLTIPNSVNNIDSYAFRGCNILSITVPKNIDKIPFWDFPSLKEIYIQSVSLSNDDFNVVEDIDGVSYYVPVESYKSFSALAGKTVIVTKPETNKSANLLQWKGTTADWEVQTDYYSRGLFTNTETGDIYLFGKKINNN